METKNEITVKDALKAAYGELQQVEVPADKIFSMGMHIGRAMQIVGDCINALEMEDARQQQEKMKAASERQEERKGEIIDGLFPEPAKQKDGKESAKEE